MAAFIAFAVGCSAAPGSEVQIAEGSAEFSQGDLVVKLDANPTTGYEWTFQIDGSAVQPDGDEFVPASDGAQPARTDECDAVARALHLVEQVR